MAPKTAHDAAKAKAAREKKILLALVVPLVVAVFFAYHTINKLHQSASTTTPPAATTPATTVSTGTPVSATTPASTVASFATLPSDTGKLTRLPLLSAKDPFHDQGPRVAAATVAQTASKSTNTKQAKKQPAAPPTSAVISVNGHLASVSLGAQFPVTNDPATNGIFRLVGLTAKSAKIAVAGGSYANGKNTLTLTVDSVVTLVNQADGKRFTLVLYPQGTPAPGATSTTTTSTTTTSTTTTPGS
ncbi:MAG TPA: hypothetical protein VKR79_00080 [Gaiellaceae bacterium]|nr:hypothetical protein [Gaiellaceae bacterium]